LLTDVAVEFTWIFQIMSTLFVVGGLLLKYGTWIVVLSFLGVLISCIYTMSIDPLWEFFSAVWSLLIQCAEVLATIGGAIGGAASWLLGLFGI
jgi:hypothetical protein